VALDLRLALQPSPAVKSKVNAFAMRQCLCTQALTDNANHTMWHLYEACTRAHGHSQTYRCEGRPGLLNLHQPDCRCTCGSSDSARGTMSCRVGPEACSAHCSCHCRHHGAGAKISRLAPRLSACREHEGSIGVHTNCSFLQVTACTLQQML
jgi:hypothetical protein